MTRPIAKPTSVLLAFGFWILACPASLAADEEMAKGKHQQAISSAEKAVEMAKRMAVL